MDKREVLKELGLTDGEVSVYLSLLKLGEGSVNKIKIDTKLNRTTIYDILDKLVKIGLASYVIKNERKLFKAVSPKHLTDYLEEKKENLEKIIPSLMKLHELEKKQVRVEVYEGVEGVRLMFNKVLKESKEFLGIGIDENKFNEKARRILERYIQKCIKLGITERLISQKGIDFVYKYPHIEYKFVEKKFFNGIPTAIFGNTVASIIWEPLTVIFIENKDYAYTYRKHFELMWKMADKKH